MDRFLYVAMTGASELQLAQAVTNNNLANASTIGFKATLAGAMNVPIDGPGYEDARAYAVTAGQGIDFTPGPIMQTGRDLDVAVDGDGWIAVQAPDGSEAYTRSGALKVDALGMLRTSSGEPVLGEGGPIAVPPYESLVIAPDGTISIRPQGQESSALAVVDRVRLVDPPLTEIVRGEDGLMRLTDGTVAVPDAGVQLIGGALEGSNVNMVGSLVQMIEQARAFEMHVKMLSSAESLDQSGQELISLT